MVAGRHKSRTFKRVFRKTPGGKTVLRFTKRKPSKPICNKCNKELLGTARGRKTEIRKLPKTGRRPERPYGGVLCSSCSRKTHIAKARA